MKRKPNYKVIHKALRFIVCKEAYYFQGNFKGRSQAEFDMVLWEVFNILRLENREKWGKKS